MKTVLKITLGILLACVVLIGGCTALIAGAASDPEVKKSVEALEDISGDNDAQYRNSIRQVELGMTQDEVRSIMGKPRSKQRMESDYGTDVTLYYGSWQLNFTDGVLESKNRF
jgi:outer membrane protein assembly factor BamE (lipoprotein component of BamABCDE complex)